MCWCWCDSCVEECASAAGVMVLCRGWGCQVVTCVEAHILSAGLHIVHV